MNMGPAQFKERRRLDHLHEPPQVADAVATVAIPAAAGFGFEQHLQRLAVGPGVAFSEAMQNCRKRLFWRGFDVDVLLKVEGKVVQCHGFLFPAPGSDSSLRE
jgi:hypothetical protein